MCIIIDANVMNYLFNGSDIGGFIIASFENGKLQAAFGGRVKNEALATKLRKIYREFLLAGRFIEYDDGECIRQEQAYERRPEMRSDDPHILALASISGCRLLFSNDTDLRTDFRNTKLLKPRGKILSDSIALSQRRRMVRDAPACRNCN